MTLDPLDFMIQKKDLYAFLSTAPVECVFSASAKLQGEREIAYLMTS